MHKQTRTLRALSWLPAALVVSASVMTTLGVSLIPGATAATDTEQVTVTANVEPEIHATNGCSGAITYATGLLTTDIDKPLGSCAVSFGTNTAASGATLTLASSGSGTPFLCKRSTDGDVATACLTGTSQFTDGSGADLAEGSAGGRQVGTPTGCSVPVTPTWTTTAATAITATAALVCTQSVVGTDGTYTFEVLADPAANQAPGKYVGRVAAVATAT